MNHGWMTSDVQNKYNTKCPLFTIDCIRQDVFSFARILHVEWSVQGRRLGQQDGMR